ncbi:MAG: hypothetical protein ACREL5_04780 [Gemmatimonadales bacterium]
MESGREPMTTMLRHTLATLAYRADKVLRDAPSDFGGFKVGPDSRTPSQILAHMGDLMDWAASLAVGTHHWEPKPPRAWTDDVARFFASTRALDDVLANEKVSDEDARKVFQGPIADALTHTGQLSMLRRLGGSPVKGENYARATGIRVGELGPGFSGPRVEF